MADYGFYLNRLLTKKGAPTGIRPNYIYGLLYNWWGASDSRIGNSGFGVPDNIILTALMDYVDTTYNVSPNNFGVSNHLKSCKQNSSPLGEDCATDFHPRWNFNATHYGRNTINFSALPNGLRANTGQFSNTGNAFFSNSITEGSALNGAYYEMYAGTNVFGIQSNVSKKYGFSCRLQRLATAGEISTYTEGQIITNYYKGNNDFLYDCVRINDRIWTVQNLAETKWSDGTDIPFAGTNGINFSNAEWLALTTAGVCAYRNDTETWAYTLP